MIRKRFAVVLVLLLSVFALTAGKSDAKQTNRHPELAADQGRVFFFGQNVGAFLWLPKLTINGASLGERHGLAIYFFVDLAPGELDIAVDGEQKVRMTLEAGQTLYVQMLPYQLKSRWQMELRQISERSARVLMREHKWRRRKGGDI